MKSCNSMGCRGFYRKSFSFLKKTPLHPQWIVFRKEKAGFENVVKNVSGLILDIGCGEKTVQKYLHQHCNYIGLDYYKTATEWYGSTPDIYGDAHKLPFGNETFDSILLLDVLEHLPDPNECLKEIYRVAAREGTVIVDVPFIYPLHDEPLDFSRWSIYGLKKLVTDHGFKVVTEVHNGKPLETAALITNISIAKTLLNWIKTKNPASILLIVAPFLIFIINVLFLALSRIGPDDKFMPWGYRLILKKQ